MPIATLDTKGKTILKAKNPGKLAKMTQGAVAAQNKAKEMSKPSSIVKSALRQAGRDFKKVTYDRPLDDLIRRRRSIMRPATRAQVERSVNKTKGY